jgi:tRNA pseudouridine13 synthase
MTDTEKTYAYDHDPIPFRFFQSVERFHVEELPQYPATGRGEWLMLKLRKQDLSTWRLLNILKAATGASDREIGYAGLKDKAATTIQYLTLPARYEKGLRNLATERIELLEVRRTRGAIRPGELRGNRFRILLDRLKGDEAERLIRTAKHVASGGIPNYFGYQRFGEDGRAWEQGRDIARSGKRLKGAKERLLVAAWQSRLFNGWLAERLRAGKTVDTHTSEKAAKLLGWPRELTRALKRQEHHFKLFHGDLMRRPGRERLHSCKDPDREARDFLRRRSVPTGLLPGAKAWRTRGDARHLEEPWDDPELDTLPGDRREAWIWPEDLRALRDEKHGGVWLEFTLPTGAYATTYLEELARRPLAPAKERKR